MDRSIAEADFADLGVLFRQTEVVCREDVLTGQCARSATVFGREMSWCFDQTSEQNGVETLLVRLDSQATTGIGYLREVSRLPVFFEDRLYQQAFLRREGIRGPDPW